jgi:hypothetical protein
MFSLCGQPRHHARTPIVQNDPEPASRTLASCTSILSMLRDGISASAAEPQPWHSRTLDPWPRASGEVDDGRRVAVMASGPEVSRELERYADALA